MMSTEASQQVFMAAATLLRVRVNAYSYRSAPIWTIVVPESMTAFAYPPEISIEVSHNTMEWSLSVKSAPPEYSTHWGSFSSPR